MTTGPEAGYYADPSIPGYIRYWDGAQWVEGTSRPAPDELLQQSVQQQAVRQQPEQQPAVQQSVQQQLVQEEPVQQPESSVATMIVPSAFGSRGAYGSGWASGGSGSP